MIDKSIKINRGAKDDVEALQMILEENLSLKSQVLTKLKALRREASDRDKGIVISEEQSKMFRMQEKRKK